MCSHLQRPPHACSLPGLHGGFSASLASKLPARYQRGRYTTSPIGSVRLAALAHQGVGHRVSPTLAIQAKQPHGAARQSSALACLGYKMGTRLRPASRPREAKQRGQNAIWALIAILSATRHDDGVSATTNQCHRYALRGICVDVSTHSIGWSKISETPFRKQQ